ncbi:MAG: DUF3592 domain-containing protein [Caldimonas sp.]
MNNQVPALCLALFGGLVLLVGLWKIVQANATASWPTAMATILAAEVGKASGVQTYYWVADLSFRYTVGAATYTSSRYSAAGQPGFFLRRTAERIVEQHRPGSHAVIAYPRLDPSQGLLAPGVQPVLIAALRIIVLGLVTLYFAWTFSTFHG